MHFRKAKPADPKFLTLHGKIRRSLVLLCTIAACLCPMAAMAQDKGSPAAGSFEQLTALAEKGNAEAQLKLAELYRTGKGAAQNVEEAAKWYRKAAEQGVAEAQFKLGELLLEGKDAAKHAVEAATWLEKAASQGFKAATDKLADLKAKATDSVQDLNKALNLIR
jgi:TPR repeat protein